MLRPATDRGASCGVVVTCAGLSTRTARITSVLPKSLLPLSPSTVAGMVDCALTRALSACRRLGLAAPVVVGSGHPWFGRIAEAAGCDHVVAPPGGEMVAVSAASDLLEGHERILVWSGDNLVALDDVRRLVEHAPADAATVGVAPVDDVRRYTSVEVRGSPQAQPAAVVRLVEKPDEGGPGLAKAGLYLYGAAVVKDLIRTRTVDRFGEWSSTEALRVAMGRGVPLRALELRAGIYDMGTRESYERVVLGQMEAAHVL